jgi:hypothetical protein
MHVSLGKRTDQTKHISHILRMLLDFGGSTCNTIRLAN